MGLPRVAQDQKKARRAKATVAFIDETGLLMAPLVRRTWAPCGKTPLLIQRGRSHAKVSIAGAICAKPNRPSGIQAYFRIYREKNIKAPACREFVRQLLKAIRGPLFLVWDRLNVHRARLVQRLVLKHRRRIQVFFFPSYAPELNPVEYAWNNLKHVKLANFAPMDTLLLARAAKKGICSTRKNKTLLISFVRHSGLSFFDQME